MNKEKIRLVLTAAEDDLEIIINKFLSAEHFNFVDLAWWWNPNENWCKNKIYAENALRILIDEGCCEAVSIHGGYAFKKTEMFAAVLRDVLQEELKMRKLVEMLSK